MDNPNSSPNDLPTWHDCESFLTNTYHYLRAGWQSTYWDHPLDYKDEFLRTIGLSDYTYADLVHPVEEAYDSFMSEQLAKGKLSGKRKEYFQKFKRYYKQSNQDFHDEG